ncbi:unnamed protein product, partial [Phaeothamnion confervicola]
MEHKPDADVMKELMAKVCAQVKPIVLAHKWIIRECVEFQPKNPRLYGMNANRGQKLFLRFRTH